MKKIKDVLGNLKQKGLSPYERAIVFSYWKHFSVYYVSSSPLPPLYHEQIEVSNRIQNVLENAPNGEWVTHKDGLRKEICKILTKKEDVADVDFKNTLEYAKGVYLICGRLMPTSFKNIISGISGSLLDEVDELSPELSEEDFEKWCNKISPKATKKTLNCPRNELKRSVDRAKIPVCIVNALVYEDDIFCQQLADSINRVCEIFDGFGVKDFALNQIDLNVTCSEKMGVYGVMSPTSKINEERFTPVVKLYYTDNEWSETLIHEYLHAHDFLLGDLIEKETYISNLDPSRHPLIKSWHKVQNSIAQLSDTKVSVEKINEMVENIAKKWSAIGLNQAHLERCIAQWRQSTHPKKDYQCIKRLEEIIKVSNVRKRPAFFARVILSQYQALENMQTEPFYKFAMEFEKNCNRIEQQQPLWDKIVSKAKIFFIRNSEMHTVDCSDKKYYADIAEQMARSMEVLVKGEKELPSAVYPSENLSTPIKKIWKNFFTSRHVQGAYEIIRQHASKGHKKINKI